MEPNNQDTILNIVDDLINIVIDNIDNNESVIINNPNDNPNDNTNALEKEFDNLINKTQKNSLNKNNQNNRNNKNNQNNRNNHNNQNNRNNHNNILKNNVDEDRHYINEDGKIFASASLTFTHSKKGLLLCNEYRFVQKEDLYHLTGGKTESYDIDILYTACREFVEETNLYINKCVESDKNILIVANKIYINIKNRVRYWDLCVNPRKNLFHRFFTFDINKFDSNSNWLRTEIITLPGFMKMLKLSDLNDNKELNELLWINNENIEILRDKFSYMLNTFYSNIDKFIDYKHINKQKENIK